MNRTGAENSRPDAHMRRTELGGDQIIPAHPHGKPCKPQIFRHFGEEGEMRRRVVFERRNAHEPLDLKPEFITALGEKRRNIRRSETRFLRLFAGVNLNIEPRAPALFLHFRRQRPRQLRPVETFDHVEGRHRLFDLVRLQGADEPQLHIRIIGFQIRPFRHGFLHPVFAENAMASLKRGPDARRVMKLRDGGNGDRARGAARLFQRAIDFSPDPCEIGGGIGIAFRKDVVRRHEGLRLRAAKLAAAANDLKRRSGVAAPFSLAFLTDAKRAPHPLLVARVLPKGAAVILREYDMPRRAGLAARLKSVCGARGVKLIIGADIELAEKIGADGVHIPRWFSPERPLPQSLFITASAHDASELRRAKALNADLALLSPAFPTGSHGGVGALGPDTFRRLAAASPIPVLALGGVDETNAKELAGPNIAGLAAIGAFVS